MIDMLNGEETIKLNQEFIEKAKKEVDELVQKRRALFSMFTAEELNILMNYPTARIGYKREHKEKFLKLTEKYNRLEKTGVVLGDCAIPILQYDKTGKFIQRFDSIQCACRSLGGKYYSNIKGCCERKYYQAKGFIFRFVSDEYKAGVDLPKEELIRPRNPKAKIAVNQYTLEGTFVRTFKSINACCIAFKISKKSIRECLEAEPGKRTSRGFQFRKASDVDGKGNIEPAHKLKRTLKI